MDTHISWDWSTMSELRTRKKVRTMCNKIELMENIEPPHRATCEDCIIAYQQEYIKIEMKHEMSKRKK